MNPTTCIHYVGSRDGNLCGAGVDIHSDQAHAARPPKHSLPCLGFVRARFNADLVEIPCPHFLLPSKEQIDADDRVHQEAVQRLQKVVLLVEPLRKQYRGKGYSGTLTCPNCGTNLFVRMATNGHMRGNCQTQGCVHWLE